MLQALVHYGLHFVFPGIIAFLFYRKNWFYVYMIFLSTMLIDLDHLVADPVFDPNRCSIGVHPLNSFLAMGLYLLLLFFKKTRILGIGLCLHILTDLIDCSFMNN